MDELVEGPDGRILERIVSMLIEGQAIEHHRGVGETNVDRRLDSAHGIDRQLQSFGGKECCERVNALPHFLMGNGDLDLSVACDFEPGAKTCFAIAGRKPVAIDYREPDG